MAYIKKLHHKKDPICTLYSPDVLVGQWYQERLSGLPHDVHAITPGIYGQSGCVEEKTTYKSDFVQPIAKNDPQGIEDFIDVSLIRFRNKMKNVETNIQQSNSKFLDNMTTMTDLQFRILPGAIRRISHDTGVASERIPKRGYYDDLTAAYGNQTNYGLLNAKRCEILTEMRRYHHMSEMKTNYGPKVPVPLSPKKPNCKEKLVLGEET